MDANFEINERFKKLNQLKDKLKEIDKKLASFMKDLNWDYKKFVEEKPLKMVTCTINSQHRVPDSKISSHEEKCAWHQQGYTECDKTFSELSECGSFISLTPELMYSITKNVSPTVLLVLLFIIGGIPNKSVKSFENDFNSENKTLRPVPQTSTNFDQNFSREEKLAIYDYVVSKTQKQNSYSDLWLQSFEKKEEKKEMSRWEIAAAERDAKRRRASYRNKVHTNRKTHTEILREVIESQMEAFKDDNLNETNSKKYEQQKSDERKTSHRDSEEKRKYSSEGYSRHNRDWEDRRKNQERESKYSERSRKRSPSFTGSSSNSRSRSHDKYRKWKTYKGRSHSHKSSHSHRENY